MQKRVKIDLHTHSVASHDGGLSEQDYRTMVAEGGLDCIAITDHNTVSFARKMHDDLGEKIIVGEEIMTRDGEIIGLYLKDTIPAHLSLKETIQHIKLQDGLVYVPHPFETVRHGVRSAALASMIEEVDIIETANGRAFFQNRSPLAKAWAVRFKKAGAAASDAHGPRGWGRTYNELEKMPTKKTLVKLLHSSIPTVRFPGVAGILYPKLNKIKKWIV